MLSAVKDSVGKWLLVIRGGESVVATVGGWHPSKSTIAGVSCSPELPAGTYSVTREAHGGKQRSSVRIELFYPEERAA